MDLEWVTIGTVEEEEEGHRVDVVLDTIDFEHLQSFHVVVSNASGLFRCACPFVI